MPRIKIIAIIGGLFLFGLIVMRPHTSYVEAKNTINQTLAYVVDSSVIGPTTCTKICSGVYKCYQPPMPTCPSGMACAQAMPAMVCVTPTPTPKVCALRSKGDANCDGVVNTSDFDLWKSAIKGLSYACANCSVDFNNDGKINVVDYEIWRNTFLK